MRFRLTAAAALAALCFAAAPGPAPAQTAFSAGGSTVSLAVTGTTSRVQIRTGPTSSNVRIYNSGTVAVFVACGDATVVAAAASAMPIAPGTVEVLGCGQQYVAGISAGTAATLYITAGSGL